MKINKLTICNISSFEGESSFDFSVTDPLKNIILIGGKNGAGKSSLFLAMKLALYGPLAFNYQGVNPVYINRIKELINHNVYIQDEVKAYTILEFSLLEEREYVSYRIKREWILINKKLQESIYVHKDGKELSKEEIIFFNEYLNTVIPANLFNLYFFDGEKIDEMFEGVKYKNFIKKSLLTLYSVDVFEILRKYFDNYVGRTKGDEELEAAQFEYQKIIRDIEIKEESKELIVESMEKTQNLISDMEIETIDLNEEFHKAGGLTEKEKEEINNEVFKYERIKSENNMKIKYFVEDLLPFVICNDHAHKVKKQLNAEVEINRYEMVKSQITPEFTKSVLVESIAETNNTEVHINDITNLSNSLFDKLTNRLKSKNDEEYQMLHDLSSERRERIIATANRVIDFNKDTVLNNINKKQAALNRTIELNKKIRESMNENDVVTYITKINDLTKLLEKSKSTYSENENKHNLCVQEIDNLEIKKAKIKETLRSKTQQSNIYDLSERLNEVMNTMVKEVSRSKFNELENHFLDIFKKIMRKDNIVDYIRIDDDFKLNLYQEQMYRVSEILTLISNIGYEKTIERVGEKGVVSLFDHFLVETHDDLKEKLDYCKHEEARQQEEFIQLYKRIELNQLSKGEKQIFTLSLYWSMIKIANHEIPFIIDTPYARIDTQHRDQITKEFFPTISEQVVILSTNEEIDEHYYKIMKDSISKEYLLINDKDENKTTVKEEYFFKGDSYDI